MKEKGDKGELIASDFLTKQGYHILEKNYQTKFGELDLIGMEGDYLCFIEVKMRGDGDSGYPYEFVTRSKQAKMSRVAEAYLMRTKASYRYARFDVVSILYSGQEEYEVELIRDAFEAPQYRF